MAVSRSEFCTFTALAKKLITVYSVYIGKLRGRLKVAICEFRDQLSESEYAALAAKHSTDHRCSGYQGAEALVGAESSKYSPIGKSSCRCIGAYTNPYLPLARCQPSRPLGAFAVYGHYRAVRKGRLVRLYRKFRLALRGTCLTWGFRPLAERQHAHFYQNRKLNANPSEQPLIIPPQLGMMLDIALGLEYLHERTPKVIHRDVSRDGSVVPYMQLLTLGSVQIFQHTDQQKGYMQSR